MNCHQVLEIIDALTLAERQQPQGEAIRRHVRDCAGCRSALATANALDAQLSRLQEPAPPVSLAAVIRARTAQQNGKRATFAPAKPHAAPAKTRSNRPAWAVLSAGVTLGLGAQAYQVFVGESMRNLTSPLLFSRTEHLIELFHGGPTILVLAAGLLLYAAGLLAPRRVRDEPQ